MTELVTLLLIFGGTAVGFLAVNLLVGRVVRPRRPDAEKETIYECGEPSIGSSWIQFDLRFYVVALLFVVFDVELAFFFPWATVFGDANKLAQNNLPANERIAASEAISPSYLTKTKSFEELKQSADLAENKINQGEASAARVASAKSTVADQQVSARYLGWIAFADILIFFGVLLVGFAYLWKRGDLDWVRSTAAQVQESPSIAESES